MREDYADIRNLTPEEPAWFDENGAPRYCEPEPRRAANTSHRG